ncbi:MAG: galactose-1-phosphate uridylyltransferase [Planctomycetes bacterium GWF2_41_51]|nr:MAG: galactose-1-phosphate uridylyltransferase [Planctomycetes bacterium GWF2_41_51]
MAGIIRQNILTQQWVVYAIDRANRPMQMEESKTPKSDELPQLDVRCPFCPGNEEQLPGILYEKKGGKNGGWSTRAVLNKYSALTDEKDIEEYKMGIYRSVTAFGRNEVIIENPLHNIDITQMRQEQVEQIIDTYLNRYNYFYGTYSDIQNVIIFRNHGTASGTSLIHPHSQIAGIAVMPKFISDREMTSKNYYQENKRCLMCDILEFEQEDNQRLVYQNKTFFCFVPFAAEVPFEIWIAPKTHQGDFKNISKIECSDFADALKTALSRLTIRLDDPDYNYVIYSCSRGEDKAHFLHWYVRIRPRTVTTAGFEIGTGMHINPNLPESDAKILRGEASRLPD